MKVVRTKTERTLIDRNGARQVKIAIYISGLNHQDEFGRYVAEVKDFYCIPRENPQPGEPLNSYELIKRQSKVRTKKEIDTLFNYIGKSIAVGQNTVDEDGNITPTGNSFTDAFADLQVESLLAETQEKPLYDTTPDEWEIADTSTEITPIPK